MNGGPLVTSYIIVAGLLGCVASLEQHQIVASVTISLCLSLSKKFQEVTNSKGKIMVLGAIAFCFIYSGYYVKSQTDGYSWNVTSAPVSTWFFVDSSNNTGQYAIALTQHQGGGGKFDFI